MKFILFLLLVSGLSAEAFQCNAYQKIKSADVLTVDLVAYGNDVLDVNEGEEVNYSLSVFKNKKLIFKSKVVAYEFESVFYMDGVKNLNGYVSFNATQSSRVVLKNGELSIPALNLDLKLNCEL